MKRQRDVEKNLAQDYSQKVIVLLQLNGQALKEQVYKLGNGSDFDKFLVRNEITQDKLADWIGNVNIKISDKLQAQQTILHLAVDTNQPQLVEFLIIHIKKLRDKIHTITALQYAQYKNKNIIKETSEESSNALAIIKLLKHQNKVMNFNSVINIHEDEYGFRYSKQAAEFRRRWTEKSTDDLTLFRNVATIKLIINPNYPVQENAKDRAIFVTMSSVTKEPTEKDKKAPSAKNHSEQIAIKLLYYGYKTEYTEKISDLYTRITCEGKYIIKWIYTERATCINGPYTHSCSLAINELANEQLNQHGIPIEVFYTKPYYKITNNRDQKPIADPIDKKELIPSTNYPLAKDVKQNKKINLSLLQDISIGKTLIGGYSNITPNDVESKIKDLPRYVENNVEIAIKRLEEEIKDIKEILYNENQKFLKHGKFEDTILTMDSNSLKQLFEEKLPSSDYQVFVEHYIMKLNFLDNKIKELQGLNEIGKTLKEKEEQTKIIPACKELENTIKKACNGFLSKCHLDKRRSLDNDEVYVNILKDYQTIRSLLNNLIIKFKKEIFLAFNSNRYTQLKTIVDNNLFILNFCKCEINLLINKRMPSFLEKLQARSNVATTVHSSHQGVKLPQIMPAIKSNQANTIDKLPEIKKSGLPSNLNNDQTSIAKPSLKSPNENGSPPIEKRFKSESTSDVVTGSDNMQIESEGASHVTIVKVPKGQEAMSIETPPTIQSTTQDHFSDSHNTIMHLETNTTHYNIHTHNLSPCLHAFTDTPHQYGHQNHPHHEPPDWKLIQHSNIDGNASQTAVSQPATKSVTTHQPTTIQQGNVARESQQTQNPSTLNGPKR
jgi:hypothetical protein